jgi:hypothetical protein
VISDFRLPIADCRLLTSDRRFSIADFRCRPPQEGDVYRHRACKLSALRQEGDVYRHRACKLSALRQEGNGANVT